MNQRSSKVLEKSKYEFAIKSSITTTMYLIGLYLLSNILLNNKMPELCNFMITLACDFLVNLVFAFSEYTYLYKININKGEFKFFKLYYVILYGCIGFGLNMFILLNSFTTVNYTLALFVDILAGLLFSIFMLLFFNPLKNFFIQLFKNGHT